MYAGNVVKAFFINIVIFHKFFSSTFHSVEQITADGIQVEKIKNMKLFIIPSFQFKDQVTILVELEIFYRTLIQFPSPRMISALLLFFFNSTLQFAIFLLICNFIIIRNAFKSAIDVFSMIYDVKSTGFI